MGCVCGKESVDVKGRLFTIKKCIGEGGFSMVYLVEDDKTGKPYAMKRMTCHSRRERKRAQLEIELHKRLAACANVISCEAASIGALDSAEEKQAAAGGTDDELSVAVEALIILPFYRRGTLQDELTWRMASREHITEPRVLQLFLGVSEGVRAFHDLKPEPYAHRDLKPGNILLAEDDKAVLMDLGSADVARIKVNNTRDAIALQDTAAEHCTMPYRAPELFHVETNAEIDEKTDIWSLGCLLYAMCFFSSPFDKVHEKGDSIALAAMAGNVQIPTSSPYSSALHKLMLSMMQVDPKQRPSIHSVIEQASVIASSSAEGQSQKSSGKLPSNKETNGNRQRSAPPTAAATEISVQEIAVNA